MAAIVPARDPYCNDAAAQPVPVTMRDPGRVDEAIAMYEQALALAPRDVDAPAARNNLGVILLAQGDPARALAHFEAALAAAPANLEAHYNAAVLYLDASLLRE
jgi:tetratricopeptide (TPR) repeat protein